MEDSIILSFTEILAFQAGAPDAAGIVGFVIPTREFAYIILLLLLGFSLLSWTIMVRKWLTFRRMERQSRGFVALFRKSARLSEVSLACEHYRGTPLSGIFAAASSRRASAVSMARRAMTSVRGKDKVERKASAA